MSDQPQSDHEAEAQEVEIDAGLVEQALENMKNEQNLVMGIAASAGAALVCAGIWAGITVATDMQSGLMAIGVGVLVGLANRTLGKGVDQIFGAIGASFALLGCVFGNLFTVAAFVSQSEDMSFIAVLLGLALNPGVVIEVMTETFSPIDLLFYGLAIYEGYKLSFRQLDEDDLAKLAVRTG